MIKKFIILFVLCQSAAFAQVNLSRDELPNLDSADSKASLNNQLRQSQNAINSIGGYFNSSGFLQESSGGTGANLAAIPNGSILVQNASNVGIGTFGQGTSGQYLQSQGAGVNPQFVTVTIPSVSSNVLFQWNGITDIAEFNVAANRTTTTGSYNYISNQINNGAYSIDITKKIIKIIGMNTVTVYVRGWSTGGAPFASVQTTIGALTPLVEVFTTATPPGNWISGTIDVSSLTNNTAYTVTIGLGSTNSGGVANFMGDVIAFGS